MMLAIFAYFSVWIGIFFGVGLWIVWPVERVARALRRPVRISIADFLCLFISIQVPLGLTAWYNTHVLSFEFGDPDEERVIIQWMAAIFFVLGIVVWWGAVRAISFCGVPHGWRRMLFLGVIVPTVYYGLLPFSLSVIACLVAIGRGDVQELLKDNRAATAVTVIVGCALLVCGVVVRKLILPDIECARALISDPTPADA